MASGQKTGAAILCFDHTLITRRASVRINWAEKTDPHLLRISYLRLVRTAPDGSKRFRFPLAATIISNTYRAYNHTLLTLCHCFSRRLVHCIRDINPLFRRAASVAVGTTITGRPPKSPGRSQRSSTRGACRARRCAAVYIWFLTRTPRVESLERSLSEPAVSDEDGYSGTFRFSPGTSLSLRRRT